MFSFKLTTNHVNLPMCIDGSINTDTLVDNLQWGARARSKSFHYKLQPKSISVEALQSPIFNTGCNTLLKYIGWIQFALKSKKSNKTQKTWVLHHTTPEWIWIKRNLLWKRPSKPQSIPPKDPKKLGIKIPHGWFFWGYVPTGDWTPVSGFEVWRATDYSMGTKKFWQKKLLIINLI